MRAKRRVRERERKKSAGSRRSESLTGVLAQHEHQLDGGSNGIEDNLTSIAHATPHRHYERNTENHRDGDDYKGQVHKPTLTHPAGESRQSSVLDAQHGRACEAGIRAPGSSVGVGGGALFGTRHRRSWAMKDGRSGGGRPSHVAPANLGPTRELHGFGLENEATPPKRGRRTVPAERTT